MLDKDLLQKLEQDKPVYIQCKDEVQSDIIDDFLYSNSVPFESYYSPEGWVYKITRNTRDVLLKVGAEFEEIEVRNIGSLTKEELKAHREYQKEHRRKNGLRTLRKMQKKYGLR